MQQADVPDSMKNDKLSVFNNAPAGVGYVFWSASLKAWP